MHTTTTPIGSLLARVAVAAALLPAWATAAVTPYSWLRGGEIGIGADSTGLNHAFNAAFSSGCNPGVGGGGQNAAATSTNTAGGPLGTTGAISTVATRWGAFNCSNSGIWVEGPGSTPPLPTQFSLPATNWVMECWMMPVGTGAARDGTGGSQFMSTGSGQHGGTPGGAAFRTRSVTDEFGNPAVEVRCDAIGVGEPANFTIGDPAVVSTERWTHLAVVNDGGVTTFYVNGVPSGAPTEPNAVSVPSGVPYIGSGQDTGAAYNGFLDELRYSTFAAGQFAVTDLLLRPAGAGFISQPQSASVWDGGAAPFEVVTVRDPDTTYQWKRNDADIAGAIGPDHILPAVTAADSGSIFKVTVTNNGIRTTTPDATLTVVPRQTENNTFFRSSIEAETSLLAFFPVDTYTGSVVTNTKDATRNATLEGTAYFDGRTTRSYGQRAIRLRGGGDATIPATPAYEFTDGTGSIEALVYLENPGAQHSKTVFSLAGEDGAVYYAFQVAPDGNSLIYRNDALSPGVTWAVSPSLLGRLAHVALVFTPGKVTAYADGLPLGIKDNPNFGATLGLPARIGSAGLDIEGAPVEPWNGSIDELAVFGDALTDNAIAVHNSRFIYGTAVTAPTIDSSPTGSWSLLSGSAPIYQVKASGTAPLTYQWKKDGVAITGNATATTASLTVLNSTAASSGSYTVTVTNPVNEVTSAPFTVTFTNPAPSDKYAALVLADGPTGYWRLNETAGTTMTDYAGGHNGTYVPANVDLGIEGPYGITPDTAVHFKQAGVSASVPYTPIHNPTGPFSVEFWAKPDQSGNIGRAILGTQNRNTGRAGYAIYQGFNNPPNAWEAHLGTGETVMFLQSSTTPVAGRWDHVVMTWNGSNFAGLYVNGRLEASDVSGLPHRNNLSQPLEIGSRFNGSVPYFGTIDEVAFYNYALTATQIEKHFSVAYYPSTITSQPTPVLNGVETNTITLTAGVTGFPNTYQWFKDGVLLTGDEINPDSSPKYPGGVAGPSLAISQSLPGDSGQYRLAVSNPLGNSETTPVAVTVVLDTTPPTVSYATASSTLNRVRIGFNKSMLASSLGALGNYVFSGGVTPTAVTLTTDPSVINITTNGMVPGTSYTLTISGVKDDRISQNLIVPAPRSITAFVQTPGLLAWDYYRGILGTDVGSLQADPQYPAGVWTSRFLTSFSSMSVTTGGNLNNNPEFGPLGDNYGAHVYGWITPTESGNYNFFLRSDDASELWISSDSSPANVAMAAFESGCCEGFKEVGDETSGPIAMVAGTSYYIEAFYKEGGGGDHIEVAWRKEGDATPAANLTPIPGTFLSTYAPPVAGQLGIEYTGGTVTLTWSGSAALEKSTNLINWTPITGATSPYSVIVTDPATYYRLR